MWDAARGGCERWGGAPRTPGSHSLQDSTSRLEASSPQAGLEGRGRRRTSTDPSSRGRSAVLSESPSPLLRTSSRPPQTPTLQAQVRTHVLQAGLSRPPAPALSPCSPPAPFLLLFPWEAAQVRGACLPGEGLGAGGGQGAGQLPGLPPAAACRLCSNPGAPEFSLSFFRTRGREEKAPRKRQ